MFAEVETGKVTFTVRRVDVDEVKLRIFNGLDATFSKRAAIAIFVPGVA